MTSLGSGKIFITREQGEIAYAMVRGRLQELPEGELLLLDFPEKQLMDASFADELLVRLTAELNEDAFGRRGLGVRRLTQDTELNIRAVIELRRLDRKIAILAIGDETPWKIIGRLEANLLDAFELVQRHKVMTAPRLADILSVAINSASNRLKRLYDLHLLQRSYKVSEQGLEYSYFPWA